ncbi:hypothetical protein CCACVL1_14854 [Corchorus capsularis]|uniref:Uncharacterized protein n=1 Tax=Corchorus capsularis TaxID=210143 RepID=A0A1R3I582_COCAP|nr:hypothetical protein CCACVL1_14854 [Corchorus capsularis]
MAQLRCWSSDGQWHRNMSCRQKGVN